MYDSPSDVPFALDPSLAAFDAANASQPGSSRAPASVPSTNETADFGAKLLRTLDPKYAPRFPSAGSGRHPGSQSAKCATCSLRNTKCRNPSGNDSCDTCAIDNKSCVKNTAGLTRVQLRRRMGTKIDYSKLGSVMSQALHDRKAEHTFDEPCGICQSEKMSCKESEVTGGVCGYCEKQKYTSVCKFSRAFTKQQLSTMRSQFPDRGTFVEDLQSLQKLANNGQTDEVITQLCGRSILPDDRAEGSTQ